MKKSQKHILSLDCEYDYRMIGVCSHHSDYRLVWSMNTELRLSLEKANQDFIVVNKKGVHVSKHPFYEYKDENTAISYFLIKNKSLSKLLIPEKEEFDYFLFIYEDIFDENSQLLKRLKNVAGVLTAVEFDPEAIPSTENLIFG